MSSPRPLLRRSATPLHGLIGCCLMCGVACSTPEATPDPAPAETGSEPEAAAPVHVKILAFNDLHGHIDGPSGSVKLKDAEIEAGGADHLAARIAQIKAQHPHTVAVTAGDMIGASPLLSALFHDEPTFEALNEMKIDVASVGNHEFDEGVDELKRMVEGGCHPVDGCQDGDPYEGADFPLLAANVEYEASGESIFPGTLIKEFDGVKVGFIGLTLAGTPQIVSPDGVRGLVFKNEAEVINRATEELQAEGVETIVVLIHEGGYATREAEDVNDCPNVSGPIVDLVSNTSPAVDVFVTGHTHQAYVCQLEGRLVTAAQSFGRLLTEIDLQIDRESGDVVEKRAVNLVIDRNGNPHPGVDQIKKKYSAIAAPLANQKIGAITSDLSRDANEDGESPLGRLIADIQLAATKGPEKGRAQVAFMNSGGIRASFRHEASGEEGAGVVTYAEAHTVQPFGNSLVTMTLTGEQLHELLESQFREPHRVRLLQVSDGFEYEWSSSAPLGEKVDPATMKLGGQPIDPTREVRVTVNSYLATGGDGFAVLERGTDRVGGPVDLEALVTYFRDNSPIEPPDDRRIRRVE